MVCKALPDMLTYAAAESFLHLTRASHAAGWRTGEQQSTKQFREMGGGLVDLW
jgi:hypothetical protein